MVTAHIKLSSAHNIVKKYDTGKLKDRRTSNEFNLELRNRFQLLGNRNGKELDSVEEHWHQIEEVYRKTNYVRKFWDLNTNT